MIKKMTLGAVLSFVAMLQISHAQENKKTDNPMLNFLLGEMAVQRNDLPAAADYLAKITKDQKIPYVLRQQFNIAYGEEDYPKALSLLQQILLGEPNNIEVLLFKTIVLARLNQLDKAALTMNEIAQLYHEDSADNGFHFLYRELKGQIEPSMFLELYQKVAIMNQYSVEVTPLLASLLVDNGRHKEAIQYLEQVIAKAPDDAMNYALLMYAYAYLNEPAQGMAVVKNAADKSDNLELKIEYLQILINEFYFAEAMDYTKALLQKYPMNAKLYAHWSYLNFALQKDDVAKDALDKVILYKGDYTSLIFRLADHARATGRLENLYEILPNINAIDVQVVRLIAEADMALRKKSYATFLAIFDELRSKFPDRVEYLYNQQLDMLDKSFDYQLLLPYAEILDVVTNYELFIYTFYKSMAYQEMGDYERMEAVLQAWLQKNPEDALALNGYGYMLLEVAKTPRERKYAMEYLKKAILLAPDEPAIMDSVGFGYLKDKNYIKAREYLWPAFNRMKQPDVIAHYILLLMAEGRLNDAKDLFSRLRIVYPEHPETIELMKHYQGILQ